jgi:hypothetical protein
MATTFTWDCTKVDVYPTYESESDVVYNVNWVLNGTSSETYDDFGVQVPYRSTVYNAEQLSLADIATGFVPFENLTNTLVTGWVTAALGDTKIDEYKAQVNAELDELINPTTISKTITD